MSTTESQAASFLNEHADVHDPKVGSGPGKAEVPFRSALKLTYEQERRLVDRALRRIEQMENELGRNVVRGAGTNGNWCAQSSNLNVDRYTFMGRRSLYELNYNNQVWWRKWCIEGGNSIFKVSNLTATISRRIARQMTAQAVGFFLGTSPWYAISPVSSEHQEFAEIFDKWSQQKTDVSKLKACHAQAIEGAVVRGETVVKTAYKIDDQIYEQFANVLVDEEGQDILDIAGDWITDKDKFVDEMQSEVDPQTGKPIPGSETPTGRRVLRKDRTTEEPPPIGVDPQTGKNVLRYEPKLIQRRMINFEGAKSEVVYWQDFLCPQNAAHVQRGGADIICHLYDKYVIDLIGLYLRRQEAQAPASVEYEETARALKLLRAAAAQGGDAKSAVDQPRPAIGEYDAYMNLNDTEPKVQVAECYLSFDANQDGHVEEIMVVIDRRNRLPIFYDYLPNVTPDGLRPFDVVRLQPIDGRWYGIGVMEMFEKNQRTIDLQLNRWNLSLSQAGRVTFYQPENTYEGEKDPHLPVNWGGMLTLKPGKKIEETLGFVVLPEVKAEALFKLIEFIVQIMMNEAGIASVNDGAAAGMDTAKLATGVRDLQKNNATMSALYYGNLEPTLQDITLKNNVLEFANAKPVETFTYFQGSKQKTAEFFSEDLADLKLNVNILMTTYKNEQVMQSSLTAVNSAQQYYASPIPVQHRLAPLYQAILKALTIPDSDELIQPLDAADGPQQPGQPQAGAPQPGAPGQTQPGQPPDASAAANTPPPVQPVVAGQVYGLGKPRQ
jgi:hypothetical protein